MSTPKTDLLAIDPRTARLFRPGRIGTLQLANRVVMAPMTRAMAPHGTPGPQNAAYYRRRAAGGAGLIITEGTFVPHPAAANEDHVPRIDGQAALAGWKHVVDEVHAEGVPIFCQLWHVGQIRQAVLEGLYEAKSEDEPHPKQIGPSGIVGGLTSKLVQEGEPATQADLDAVVEAFGVAAFNTKTVGFDGVELHGGHGYLFDQFFWPETNRRTDRYGGSIANRVRLAVEAVQEIRRRVGPDFPISFRISQWKQQDFKARIFETPEILQAFLTPLAEAGVDVFHCSQRRFWETEFGSEHNLAYWAKRVSGRPTISVGSVGMTSDHVETLLEGDIGQAQGLGNLLKAMDDDEFDFIAIGRAMLVDPEWANKVRRGAADTLKPYTKEALLSLV